MDHKEAHHLRLYVLAALFFIVAAVYIGVLYRKKSAAPCWTRRSRGRIRTLSTSSNFCARKI